MYCVLRGCRRAASVSKLALFAFAGTAAFVHAGAALAQDTGIPDPSIATSLPPELADPGGVRAAWARHGVLFGVNYIGEVFGPMSGGYDKRAYYDGRLEVAVSADLEKMLGLKGLSFFANGYQIHGESISGDLGVLMPVSFIEANPSTRLFEIWLEQKLLDDKLSIRFGQIAADSEFILSDGGGAFINGTWGWPSITAEGLPQGGPAYPLATPGVRVAFMPNDNLTLMAGFYNGRPGGDCPESGPEGGDAQECNEHGLDFPTDDPVLSMFEGAYKYEVGGLSGTIKLGGWHQEGDYALFAGGLTENSHGLYGVIDQVIYKFSEDRNISFFGRVIGTPEDRNFVDLYWEAGLTATGLIASRPSDVLGVGFAHSGISDDAAAAEPGERFDYEALLEVSYTAQIVPGLSIQPDFQYFWSPGGSELAEDVAVIGVRSTINY
jgi:porin